MPTVLCRTAAPAKMVFHRVLPLRPSALVNQKLAAAGGPSRCLFGVPDHQESIRVAREEIKEEQKRLAQKYNFDFENEAPMPGKFQYEKITSAATSSAATSSSNLRDNVDQEVARLLDQENLDASSSNRQKNLTHFYTIARKRQACSTFTTPKSKFPTNTSRVLRTAELSD